MDSKLVVEQMSGRWKIKHPDMRPLAAEAQEVFPPEAVGLRVDPACQEQARGPARERGHGRGETGREWSAGESTAELDAARRGGAGRRGGAAARPRREVSGERAAAHSGWGPDLGPPTTLVLLRHGETPLTPEKRFSGSGGTDPELSAAGRRQAQAVARALAVARHDPGHRQLSAAPLP